MDDLIGEFENKPSWWILFANNIVLADENIECLNKEHKKIGGRLQKVSLILVV